MSGGSCPHKCVESSVHLCVGPKWTCVRGIGGQTWTVAPLIAPQTMVGGLYNIAHKPFRNMVLLFFPRM